MALEIELKARLDDAEPIKKRLFALGSYYRSYEKLDSYWYSTSAAGSAGSARPADVRIRREQDVNTDGRAMESVLVTYKKKEMLDGVEINDEREFTVSDAALFEELLCRLGCHKAVCKEKHGLAWIIPPAADSEPSVMAELSMVTNLGWFLELEIITADGSRQAVEENRKLLLSILEKLEIPADCIESRPYTALLAL